jgi:hypothetical protein
MIAFGLPTRRSPSAVLARDKPTYIIPGEEKK